MTKETERSARVGTTFGRWKLLRFVGAGAIGCVYEVEHSFLSGRRRALKLLDDELGLDGVSKQRFLDEATAAGRAIHENILQILDGGIETDGSCFAVMEYLDGRTLARVLEDGPLGGPRTIALGIQAAEALAAAHRAHIVHRFLKANNIFLIARSGSADFVKIADFGVAQLRKRRDGGAPIALLGTPSYMSPEQWRKLPDVDGRADIYALGLLLYRCLTGKPPFQRRTPGEWKKAHLEAPVPDPAIAGKVPRELGRVIVSMLAKRREDRPQTMDEVVRLLRGAAKMEKTEAAQPAAPAESRADAAASGDGTKGTGRAPIPAPARAPIPAPAREAIPDSIEAERKTRPYYATPRGTAGARPAGKPKAIEVKPTARRRDDADVTAKTVVPAPGMAAGASTVTPIEGASRRRIEDADITPLNPAAAAAVVSAPRAPPVPRAALSVTSISAASLAAASIAPARPRLEDDLAFAATPQPGEPAATAAVPAESVLALDATPPAGTVLSAELRREMGMPPGTDDTNHDTLREAPRALGEDLSTHGSSDPFLRPLPPDLDVAALSDAGAPAFGSDDEEAQPARLGAARFLPRQATLYAALSVSAGLLFIVVVLLVMRAGGEPVLDAEERLNRVALAADRALLAHDFDEAIARCDEGLALDPRSELLRAKRARAEAERKPYAAYAAYLDAAKRGKADEALTRFADLTRGTVYWEAAHFTLPEVEEASVAFHLEAARALVPAGCAEARAHLAAVLQVESDNVEARSLAHQCFAPSRGSARGVKAAPIRPAPAQRAVAVVKRPAPAEPRPIAPARRPAAPPTAGARDRARLLAEAQKAFLDGRYASARELARQSNPDDNDVRAWRLIGTASCNLRDRRVALVAWNRLTAAQDRQLLGAVCKRNRIPIP